MWADMAAVVYGADSDAAARAGFRDQEMYALFERPRDTWPMPVRQRERHLAEEPLRTWARSHPAEKNSVAWE